MGGAGAGAPGSAKLPRRAKLRANSADGYGGSSSVHSYGSTPGTAGGASRSDAMRLRLENALRNAESGSHDGSSADDWMADMGSGSAGGGAGGGVASIHIHSGEGHHDTTAPLNDAPPAFNYGYTGSRRRRARSHGDLERMGTTSMGGAGGGVGLYSSSLAREENRRRSEAYHDDQAPNTGTAHGAASWTQPRSRYSTGNFSTDDDDDDGQYGAAAATGAANGSSKSFDSKGSRSSVGLNQIAHSLDVEERYGLPSRGGWGMGVYAPSAKDILNANANAQGMGAGTGGFGYDDDGDRWAAREQRWLHQQRDKREEEMMGVGVHRDVDLHTDDQGGNEEERKQHDKDEERRLDELRRRSIGGSSGSDRRIRRSSMGQTVSSDTVPRVFAGSLASMGISISRNIAEEIPEPAVQTPTTTAAASRSAGLTYRRIYCCDKCSMNKSSCRKIWPSKFRW